MSPLYHRMFGKERVTMGKQLYCSHFFNHLLYVVFFGEWLNHSFHPFELISSTKNTKLVHIGSHKRLVQMTDVNGLSPFQVTSYNNSQKYREKKFVAGKAMLFDRLGGEVVGYVIEETDTLLHIKIDNLSHDVVRMKRPIFNGEEGRFSYDEANENDNFYKWVEYHPIRFKLMKSGKVNFTINRMHINVDEDVIVKI